MSEMPRGWVEVELREVVLPLENCDPTKDGELPFRYVDIGSINNKSFSIENPKRLLGREAPSRARRRIRNGDVLFSTVRTYLKNIALVPEELNGEVTSTGIAVLRPSDAVLSRFLFAMVRSEAFIRPLSLKQDGTLYPAITDSDLLSHRIALPPLAEQKRIVAKLDALNAKSARARTELARIETLVSRYKQAVLSKAFSGELTREWRAAANQSDTIDAVLKFIRSSRRNSPKLARRKAASGVPQAVLPETWRWISPDELASDDPYSIGIGPFGSNLVKGDYRARGVRLVFVRDIRRENFSLENAVFISEAKADELHQHSVTGGDLLITKMGDPPGDTAIFPNEQAAAVITADCIKVRPHLELTFSKFLYWAIRSNIVKEQILEETKGVAQQKLSLDRFRQIAIPTPPIEEQHEIVRRIESAFAKIDRLAAEARRALNLVGKLDEAILAKAFRGELVPQDENDEPAEKLLERIRAERAAAPKGRRGRGRH